MLHRVVFCESENFLFFQRYFMVNWTHCNHIFSWVQLTPVAWIIFIFLKLNVHRHLTFALNGSFQTLHGVSHKVEKTALSLVTCSSLSTLSRSWHTNLFFSKPARQKLNVFRESKSLNDDFQMNIRQTAGRGNRSWCKMTTRFWGWKLEGGLPASRAGKGLCGRNRMDAPWDQVSGLECVWKGWRLQ